MQIFTPVALPRLCPDNWETFWQLWKASAKPMTKVKVNHGLSQTPPGVYNYWVGVDIFRTDNEDLVWEAPTVDWRDQLPNLYRQIDQINSFDIYRVRLLCSQVNIFPHSDTLEDRWCLRAFFHVTNPRQCWYFTRPGAGADPRARRYITMPQDTNWFMYNDHQCWHGTDFDANHKKILCQIFSHRDPRHLLDTSLAKYGQHTITVSDLPAL